MKPAAVEPPGLYSFEPISLERLLPKTPPNKHFYSDGISRLLPRLTLKVHTDLEMCYLLWDKFSPRETLFDLWEFRYAALKGYGYNHYFYTLYEGKKALGTLPLWFNHQDNLYEWLGGYWMEGNRFMAEDDRVIDLLLRTVPVPIKLLSIESSELGRINHKLTDFSPEEDLKYTKSLAGMKTMNDLLATYTKKRRYNMRADYRRIINSNPRAEFIEDDPSPVEDLFTLNYGRFDNVTKVQSLYKKHGHADFFRHVVKTPGLYKYKFLKTSIGGHVASVDLLIMYKDTYYQYCGANDIRQHKGIGNFMVYAEFEDAIKRGYSVVDCLQEDHTWKHRYFDARQMYVFQK